MFIKSIRWRLQVWQAFLLVCILSGFGVTAFQLHRTNRLHQIDAELARRVAALRGDVAGPPGFRPPPGRPPFDRERMTNDNAFGPGQPPQDYPFNRGRDFQFGRGPGRDRGGPGREPGGPGREPGGGPGGHFDEFLESREISLTPRTSSLFNQWDTNDFFFAIWSRGGKLLKLSTNAPPGLPPPEPVTTNSSLRVPNASPSQTPPDRLAIDTSFHTRMGNTTREAYQLTEIGECILVGRSIQGDMNSMKLIAWWLAAAGGAVLAIGLGGGWLLATQAMRPLEEISATANRISAGNLSERIDADTDSELGRLAGVLNSTFARLEAAFAQQKQFTANASHELRTPIAVLISEAQTTLARERSAAEYRETVEGCLETAQQMRRLTHSLMELARYDAGQEQLERSPVDLAEQTRACIELIQPLAGERGIQIHSELAPATTLGDADRLNQVIVNLLTNAIHYNRDQGQVHASTRTEAGMAIITIADSGSGISAEDLPHVFERFYRADQSRGGTDGHSGLGLAICKAIVEAHGGSIEASSQPGAGSRFTVKLPCQPAT